MATLPTCIVFDPHSTAEMVCAGVLPIMQMRNVMPPVALIARRIPRHILELTYTIKLPPLPGDAMDAAGKPVLSPQQLLESYCQARGLFRARALGESDMPRAARQILKDFTDGRLLFCHPPGGLTLEVGRCLVVFVWLCVCYVATSEYRWTVLSGCFTNWVPIGRRVPGCGFGVPKTLRRRTRDS